MAKHRPGNEQTRPKSKKRSERLSKKGQPFPKGPPVVALEAHERVTPQTVRVDEQYLTTKQAMALAGVKSRATWLEWIRKKLIPPARVIGIEGGHRTVKRHLASEVHTALQNSPKSVPKDREEAPDES